jgi:hypothetical protein
LAELMTPPRLDLRTSTPADLDRALQAQAVQLIQQGKVFQVAPGTKLRVLGYLNADRLPMQGSDGIAAYAKVEVAVGTARREGFTVADGIAE